MDDTISIQKLLLLRKGTRALAELLRAQLRDYVAALTPLIRPKLLLGDFVSGTTKESPNFADKAFQELAGIYQSVAGTKPFVIPRELKSPLEVTVTPLELHPFEYAHQAKMGGENKAVHVTSPLKWVLSYPGYSIAGLRGLLAERSPSTDLLQKYAIHYSLLRFVIQKQPGFSKTLAALRFPVSFSTTPEFGNLPLTFVTAPLSTTLPPDEVIIENTEISGSNSFEEIVRISDISKMSDPLQEQIAEALRGFGPDLMA